MAEIDDCLLVHLADDRRPLLEPADVYLVEADEGNTRLRTRNGEPRVW
jgi:hypothetical protein